MNASLLVGAAELDAERLDVEGEDHRHLFRARRLGPGAHVRVTDGAGRHRDATVVHVDRRRAELELGDWLPVPTPPCDVAVMVATPRNERARWLVEKLVELGVADICFVRSQRVNHPLGPQIERLERVAKSALLQCGSARLPRLEERTWDELELPGRSAAEHRFLLAPNAEEALVDVCELPRGASAEIWIGPEGGFTEDEENELSARGVRPVHLGPLVLRVETAATVAAGLLLAR